ncbi:Por secretion system C-terminal sorting domain-containing protein [Chryseobacterium taeanense]|uniref:Por secretion system C-terminal sorting domain-containing protein n=1 Tax=Chryseobacterium taeanense TaxID=311334 RepID=A0A1G8FTQ5_9FLAO|nr:T9SS type A sorting domain-containing protein [Chryseobacterium taeanense]SDH85519.1 Por secretion system C-terminal sorting domain-containing protein [Chryseobacterium taeanense]
MKSKVLSLKSIVAAAMIFSAAEANAQSWQVLGNGGITSSNYAGTVNAVPFYLRTNGSSSNPGQAILNEVGSFLVESVNNSNVAKTKGSIIAGSSNILGSNANSCMVSGWQNDLSDAGGANIVAGQANRVFKQASKSVALGWANTITASNQFAVGVGVELSSEYSGGFGIDLIATGNRSFVFGAGTGGGSKLTNNIPSSLMFGVSSTPTMLIQDQRVGIGTVAPTAILHTNGRVRMQNLPSGSGRALVVDANGNVMVANTVITKMAAEKETDFQNQIDELKNEITELKELLKQNKITIDLSSDSSSPKLYQNTPNPGRGETTIKYYLPKDVKDASIGIYNISGQLIKTVSLKEKGNGSINISGIRGGSYVYNLNIDGKNIDSKKMLIQD